jgi:anti-sigma-K factor RskA
MTPQEHDELEQQASEYALGTLSGDERARFERALTEHVWLQQRVDDWSRRLAPLAEAVAPVAPSPAVWSAIEARIAQDRTVERSAAAPSLWDRIGFWRWSAIAATAIATLLVIYVAADFRRSPTGEQIAVLTSPQGSPAVVVAADTRQRALTVRALADAPSGHTQELWIITGANQKPRSLGTMATAGTARLPLPQDLVASLAGATLAVSLEPSGGSPTGLPTGPVLYTGQVIAVN